MRLVRLAPLATLFAFTAHASADGLYVVAEATHSKDSLKRDYFDGLLGSAGATGLSSSASGGSNQFRLQAGYLFSPNWAAEAGYIDFGKSRYTASFAGSSAQGTLKAGGIDAVGLVLMPFDSGFTIFGKAGIVFANVKSTLSSAVAAATADQSSSAHVVRPLIGAGASFKVSEHIDLRGDIDYVNKLGKSSQTGTMNATMFSLGAVYKF